MTERSIRPALSVAEGALTAGLLVLLSAAPLAAARTQTFLETNQEDFGGGEAAGIVWTSLGTLRLGRAVENLLADTLGVDYVADLVEAPGGIVYAVTGGDGRIYRLEGKKAELFATLPDAYLFCGVADPKGVLYVGSGGTKGRIFRVESPKVGEVKIDTLFEDPETKYVWDLAWLAPDTLAAATGDQGKVLQVTTAGRNEVLFDSEAKHILCLAAREGGTLYAGTDDPGLVYRWADKKAFILYEAEEPEITGLALDAQGNLYVGASSGTGGRAGGIQIAPEPAIKVTPPKEPEAAPEMLKKDAGPPKDPAEEGAANPPAPAGSGTGFQPVNHGQDAHATSSAPTQSLAERLRDAMRQAARRTGARPSPAGPSRGTGSSVYRIAPDGIVTRIFQGKDRMLLALALADGRLLIGTGQEGRIHEVDLGDSTEETCIADVDPKQVMALAATADGRVLAGTASQGRVYVLSKGHAAQGAYTSRAYDAGGSARWGTLDWRGTVPPGCQVSLATRTGNVKDPEKGLWSPWSKEMTKAPAKIEGPAGRFIQFRVTMKTGRDDATPVLEQYEAAYLRVNEPPRITAITHAQPQGQDPRAQALQRMRQMMAARGRPEGGSGAPPPAAPQPAPQPLLLLQWQAEDPNGDALRFDLSFRGQGEPVWIPLEKDLLQPQFSWDTTTVADGWYEVQVVASDRADNPADETREARRASDPILVDNTAPLFEDVRITPVADGVEVHVKVRDATSRLVEAAYTVDSATEWQVIAPVDRLFDSTQEEFRFKVSGLAPGPHRLAIRASDQAGNTGHVARTLPAGP
jgi:hypothetical protein